MQEILETINNITGIIEEEKANPDKGVWIPKSANELDWYIELSRPEILDLQRNLNDIEERLLYYQNKKNKIIKELEFIDSRIQAKTELFIQTQDKSKLPSTKTQYTLNLPNGKIKIKKATEKIKAGTGLIEELGSKSEFIENKQTLKWGELKKVLKKIDGKFYDTSTGEEIKSIEVEEVPEIVSIEY